MEEEEAALVVEVVTLEEEGEEGEGEGEADPLLISMLLLTKFNVIFIYSMVFLTDKQNSPPSIVLKPLYYS